MCKSITPNMGRKIRRYIARFLTFPLMFVMLFSNTPQVLAATEPLYSYPDDTSVVEDSTINNASLKGVYLSDASNSDYSFSSDNYTSSRELKAGILNNDSYPASQFNGADGNGVDLLPNFQIAFNENIIGNSDTYSNYTNNKNKVTLVKVNDEGTEGNEVETDVTKNNSLNGSLFVSPKTELEPGTSYKVKVSSGITADKTPVTSTNYAYEILFKTKALTSSIGVTLDKDSDSIAVGSTSQITATVSPEDATNKGVTWVSDKTEVATVDTNGLVKAIAAGEATITVTTADGGFEAKCTVTVTKAVAPTGVTLDKDSESISVGETSQLTATVAPEDATNKDVTWASNEESIATVDENGLVKAKAEGEAKITVTTDDGKFTAECIITVKVPLWGPTDELSVKNIKSTTLTLNWPQPNNSDIETYEVFYGTTKYTCTKNETEYNVTGLTANTDYTFTVKALDKDGKELGSITKKTKTLSNPDYTLEVEGSDSGYIGDTLTVKATINSEVDVYGFMVRFDSPSPYGPIVPDIEATQEANSGIEGLTVSSISAGKYVSFLCNPVEQRKVITADTPLTLILKYKVVNTGASAAENFVVKAGSGSNQLVLFTDPDTKSDKLNINNAVKEGKASTPSLIGGPVNLHTLFYASVVFDNVTAKVGGKEQPTEVTAKITAPTDKDVYGFQTYIKYGGNKNIASDLQLDPVATKAANAEIGGGKLNVTGTMATSGSTSYSAKTWVESDGLTPIIEKGETIDLKLVFKILPFNQEGKLSVSTSPYMVLFTDPSIRVQETDAALKAMVLAQEGLGKITCAGPVEGSITLEREINSLTMSPIIGGSGNVGSYNLYTPQDLLTFADAVNNLGYTAINATIKNNIDMTGTDFAGIGTKEHPFVGMISGGNKTITIDRKVEDGSSDVGGLVNYLGSGGILKEVHMAGTITGEFGGANVGGLVGVSTGGEIQQSIISSVSISGTASDGANIGGFVGLSNIGICSATYSINIYNGSISITAPQGSSNVNVGGIVGTFDGSDQTDSNRSILYCSNTGDISGGTNTGGIVGSIKNGIIKEKGNGDYNTDNKLWGDGGVVSGDGNTGGVAGQATGTTFNNVFNSGAVSGSSGNIGGIVGMIYGTGTSVLKSYNNATVTGSTGSVGGIVGKNDSSDSVITANFNLGKVTAGDPKLNAGGIVGKATANPAVYKGNYYIKNGLINSDISDALEDTTFTDNSGNFNAKGISNPDSFSLKEVSLITPGYYIYEFQPPLTDEKGTYLLSTVDDILWFYQTVNYNDASGTQNKINGKLENNIDMSKVSLEQFSGIGADNGAPSNYAGTFDGAGFTVTIKNSSLFDTCKGATIKNLTVDGSLNLTGYKPGGGIVSVIRDGTIENCHNKANISSIDGKIGGIAYRVMNTKVSNCTNSGNITGIEGTYGEIGGIIGIVGGLEWAPPINGVVTDTVPTHSVIINCVNLGNVTGEKTIGGIIGQTSGKDCTVDIIKCINKGKVTSIAQTSPGGNRAYTNAAGGILGGALDLNVKIEGCENFGDVTGTANNLGGIVGVVTPAQGTEGDTSIKVTDSTNSGKVSCTVDPKDVERIPINTGDIYVGGIIGNIKQSQNLKDINVSGNNSFGEVDKGVGKNGDLIVASKNPNGIGNNNTTRPNPPGGGGNSTGGGGNSTGGGDNQPGGGDNQPGGGDNSTGGGDNSTGGGDNQPGGGDNSTGGGDNSTGGGDNPTGGNNQPGSGTSGNTEFVDQGTMVALNSPNNKSTESNPEPVETNTVKDPAPVEDANNTSEESTEASEKATKPVSESETIFEVVKDVIQNNPIIIRGLLLFVVILVGLGGFRRYKKSRE